MAEDPSHLTAALWRIPELAGRSLTLTPISGGLTNRNFLVEAAGVVERHVLRLAGNDTHLLGISRELEHAATVAAAGVGVGPEVTAFLRPEGYLVTRFIDGAPVSTDAMHDAATLTRVADSLRRVHGGPPVPGLFDPLRIAALYAALARARGAEPPPQWERAERVGRDIERVCLASHQPMTPCHNDLLNANLIDDGVRIRIVDWEYAGMGDPWFDLGNLAANHDLTGAEAAHLARAWCGRTPTPADLGRLELMRVASDIREGMWGVLQQAISVLDVDFPAYAAQHLDRALARATTPAFAAALRAVSEGG
jgi:thiamine kinase-like enzyme